MRRMSPALPVGVMIVIGLVIGACTGNDEGSSAFSEVGSALGSRSDTTSAAGAESPEGSGGEAALSDRTGSGGDSAVEPVPVAFQVTTGRQIIFTADLTVAVTDVVAAEQEAVNVVAELGGFLFGQRSEGSPDSTSVLTFKVAPENFDSALAGLGELGEVRVKNVTASDVTERIVDVESQIATAEASVVRLRALLGDADDIKQIVALEKELLKRETTLEGLRGQLRTLEDQVALATIVIAITEAAANPKITLALTGYTGHDDGEFCPGDEDLVFDSGSLATLCYSLTNAGDTNLAGFELRDPVLDIGITDLVPVVGDPSEILEPGETIVLAIEIAVDRSLRLQTSVTAQPVDDQGATVSGEEAKKTVKATVGAIDPGGVPSFSEGLKTSLGWLVSLGELVLVVLGGLIPFAWVPLLLWLVLRIWTRRTGPTRGQER